MYINTSVMQNCGFEDLAQWPSPRPSLKHSCSCRSLAYEDLSIDFGRTNFRQKRDMACKLGLRALLEPAIMFQVKINHMSSILKTNSKNATYVKVDGPA